MSFVKALAAVAMGFAAAKGMDKYRKMGGAAGMQDVLQNAGSSPLAEQLGAMAERFGVPGGGQKVREMFDQMGGVSASAAAAGSAGLGGLLSSLRGAAETGSKASADMMEAMFGKTPVGAAMEEQARLMLRAMIQAAKADGEIDPEEQAAIMEHLGDISDEERAFVAAEMKRPIDIPGLVAETGDTARAQVYAMSLSAIRPDNDAETRYLDQLAAALGLNQATRARIHAGMGVPAPTA